MPKIGPPLDRLKTEILDYLRTNGLSVFYSLGLPGDDGFIYWDAEQYPDWRQFIDVGRESGVRLFLFSARTLTIDELQTAREALEDANMEPQEREDASAFLDSLREYIGRGAWVRVAWQQEGRRFAYERTEVWFENFLDLLDELGGNFPEIIDEEDNDEPGGSGGYYSLN